MILKVRIALCTGLLFAAFAISYLLFGKFSDDRDLDPFTMELDRVAEMRDRDITSIARKYIPIGSDLAGAIHFLGERGFEVYKTNPKDWHELKGDGRERYLASKKSVKRLIFIVKSDVILVSDGFKILDIYGRIHLTGF